MPQIVNTMTTIEHEITLLDRVLTMLAFADNDAQLESILQRFLVPVLAKLDSPSNAVQKKCLEVVAHIRRRVVNNDQISLPTQALLQFFLASHSPLAFRITFLLLKSSVQRLSTWECPPWINMLLEGIHGRSKQLQDASCFVAMQMVEAMLPQARLRPLTPEPEEEEKEKVEWIVENPLKWAKHPLDVQIVLDNVLDMMLATPISQENPPPPGLSLHGHARALGDIPHWKEEDWKRRKRLWIKVLDQPLFPPTRITLVLLAAAYASGSGEVMRLGESAFRKIVRHIDKEEDQLVRDAYALYLGSAHDGRLLTSPVDDPTVRAPASVLLKQHLLSDVLSRSRLAANMFPLSLKVIFDGFFGQGAHNAHLRGVTLPFVHWVVRHAINSQLQPMAPILVDGLLRLMRDGASGAAQVEGGLLIAGEGGAARRDDSLSSRTMHSFTYDALAEISLRHPELFCDDVDILQRFFIATTMDNDALRSAARHALTTLCRAYGHSSRSEDVFRVVAQAAGAQRSDARLAAVLYLNSVFPFDHPGARMAVLMCAGDKVASVRDEARNGLEPFRMVQGKARSTVALEGQLKEADQRTNRIAVKDDNAAWPSWKHMVQLCMWRAGLSTKVSEECEKYVDGLVWMDHVGHVDKKPRRSPRPLESKSFEEVLLFLRRGLRHTIASHPVELVRTLQLEQELEGYDALIQFGIHQPNPELQYVASMSLQDMSVLLPDWIASTYASQLKWLQSLVKTAHRPATRRALASVLGTVVRGVNSREAEGVVRNLIHAVGQSNSQAVHGALIGLGTLIKQDFDWYVGHVIHATVHRARSVCEEGVVAIVERLEDPEGSLALAACDALGRIGADRWLPLPASTTQKDVMKQLTGMLRYQEEKENVLESVITCVGRLCAGSDSDWPHVRKALLGLRRIRRLGIQFVVGEAWALYGGWMTALQDRHMGQMDNVEQGSFLPGSEQRMSTLLLDMLSLLDTDTHSGAHQSIAVWLASLLKQGAGHHPGMARHLLEIQHGLLRLLGDPDEITQEIASHAMSLAFRAGDGEMQTQLAHQFVQTLTGTTAVKGTTVGPDSKIFGDQSSITTYRELCSVAQESGKPQVVYQLMELAGQSRLWSTRAGVALGWSGSHQEETRKALQPFLPTLVPRLFRMRRDPTPRIAASMTSIWRTLLANGRDAVRMYWPAIAADLAQSLVDRLWRTREAACVALSDALPERSWADMSPFVRDIQTALLRVLDDPKETVRKAAVSAASEWSSFMMRCVDPNSADSIHEAGEATGLFLQVLMDKGLTNKAKEVQDVARKWMIRIARAAGPAIGPHAADVAPIVLEGLSALEDRELSFLQMQATSTLSAQKISQVRAHQGNALEEVLDRCIMHIRAEQLDTLAPHLTQLIRNGVGLPTRFGVARFITMLCLQLGPTIRPISSRLLKALRGAVNDSNSVVSEAMANAAGHVARYSSVKAQTRLVDRVVQLYMGDPSAELTEAGAHRRRAAMVTLRSLSRRAPDCFTSQSMVILPVCWLAMHAPPQPHKEGMEDVWKLERRLGNEMWTDHTVDTATAANALGKELMESMVLFLRHASRMRRQQAGLALGEWAPFMAAKLEPWLESTLLPALLEALRGKVWEGKSDVLRALGQVVSACPYGLPVALQQQLLDLAVRGCYRKDKLYICAACETIGRLSHGFSLTAAAIYGKIREAAEHVLSGDPTVEMETAAYTCLGEAFPAASHAAAAHTHGAAVWKVLLLGARGDGRLWVPRASRAAALHAAALVALRLKQVDGMESEMGEEGIKVIVEAAQDARRAGVRAGAADLAGALLKWKKDERLSKILHHLASDLHPDVRRAVEKVKMDR